MRREQVVESRAFEVFVYVVTFTTLLVVIVGSHLVVWDDMERREQLRVREGRKSVLVEAMEKERRQEVLSAGAALKVGETQVLKRDTEILDEVGSLPVAVHDLGAGVAPGELEAEVEEARATKDMHKERQEEAWAEVESLKAENERLRRTNCTCLTARQKGEKG